MQIVDAQPLVTKGKHCYKVEMRIASLIAELPKESLQVISRITNYHRTEYPRQRTCAMNVNGSTAGDEIYGDDVTELYNQIFAGAHQVGSTNFDYFLSLDPITKRATRTRVHILKPLSETDVDCVGLQLMN